MPLPSGSSIGDRPASIGHRRSIVAPIDDGRWPIADRRDLA